MGKIMWTWSTDLRRHPVWCTTEGCIARSSYYIIVADVKHPCPSFRVPVSLSVHFNRNYHDAVIHLHLNDMPR